MANYRGSSSLLVKPHKNNYFLDRNLILSDDLVLPNSCTASHSIDFHQRDEELLSLKYTGMKRVLVVDDSLDNADVISLVLIDANYEVRNLYSADHFSEKSLNTVLIF